jgi:hypothetical protein
MGKLTGTDGAAREVATEVLDKALWWDTLSVIVLFLRAKGVEQVRVEFGFVLERDLEGIPQGKDGIIQLNDLESFIRRGFDEGTIEWAGLSDFFFWPVGRELAFMLCNDADVHLASADSSLLLELVHEISSSGIKVYDSGQLI